MDSDHTVRGCFVYPYFISWFVLVGCLIHTCTDDEEAEEFSQRVTEPICSYMSDHWIMTTLFIISLLYAVLGSILIWWVSKMND